MRAFLALLLLLAAQPTKASVGAPAMGDPCGEGQACARPEVTKGSSLLQSRQLLGKGIAAEEEGEAEAAMLEEPTHYPDTTAAEERLASLLARGPPPPSALEDKAATRSSAVYSCPSSCQWCEASSSRNAVTMQSDVKYGEAPNLMTGTTQDLLMDVYQVPSSVASRPVLVVIHGGSFKSTSAKDGGWAPWVSKLVAQRGFLAVSVEYRRYGDCGSKCDSDMPPRPLREHPAHDIKAAVRYIRKNAAALKADPNRIALFGCSAGGEIAASATQFDWGEGDSGNPGYPSEAQAVIVLSGAPHSTWRRRTSGIPPFLSIHNEVDDLVPYSKAQTAVDYVKSTGATAKLITLPGSGHCPDIFLGYSGPSMLEDFMGFLSRYLQLPGATCPNVGENTEVTLAPTPAPTPPTPAPPDNCPAHCKPPECTYTSYFKDAWGGDRCIKYCSNYNGGRICTTTQYGTSHDCTICGEPATPPSTPSPTPPPTAAPTAPPTPAPTAPPTPVPTPLPTPMPTAAPTPMQTPSPTPMPTPCPTALPTPEPTASPTPVPTSPPTSPPAPPPAPAPAPQQGAFKTLPGACRRGTRPRSKPYMYTVHHVEIADRVRLCQEICTSTAGCTGVEVSTSGKCEVWSYQIGYGAKKYADTHTCYKYTP